MKCNKSVEQIIPDAFCERINIQWNRRIIKRGVILQEYETNLHRYSLLLPPLSCSLGLNGS